MASMPSPLPKLNETSTTCHRNPKSRLNRKTSTQRNILRHTINPPNTETEKKETELRHTPYKSSPKSSLHPSNQVRSTTNHQHKSSFEPKRNSPPAIVRNTTTPSRRWKLQTCVAASESRPKEEVVKRESRSKRGKSS